MGKKAFNGETYMIFKAIFLQHVKENFVLHVIKVWEAASFFTELFYTN